MPEGEALRRGRQAGRRSEREALLRAHYPSLLAFVLGQVENLDRAKEIAAGAFSAVLHRRLGEPVPVEPKISLFSKAWRAVELERTVDAISPLPSSPAPIHKSSQLRRVESSVRTLGSRERGVLSLRFDAGLSCREIGLIMGMNEAEVMLDVLTSLRQVKAHMANGGAYPGPRRPTRRAG